MQDLRGSKSSATHGGQSRVGQVSIDGAGGNASRSATAASEERQRRASSSTQAVERTSCGLIQKAILVSPPPHTCKEVYCQSFAPGALSLLPVSEEYDSTKHWRNLGERQDPVSWGKRCVLGTGPRSVSATTTADRGVARCREQNGGSSGSQAQADGSSRSHTQQPAGQQTPLDDAQIGNNLKTI